MTTDIIQSIKVIKEVPSTNSYLAQLCKENKPKEYQIVITENQTAGRGQRGNTWESEPGKNLTFSTVLYPEILEAKEQFFLSMLTAFAVINALKKYTNGFSIKWPNDIYWKDKKIGGILIENELEGKYISQSIIGIGLNVNQKTFRSSAPNPISLCQILGVDEIDRIELLRQIMTGIYAGYELIYDKTTNVFENIQMIYENNLYRKEGFHPYRDAEGEFMARIQAVESDGHLVLEDNHGNLRRYTFKEVEFILP